MDSKTLFLFSLIVLISLLPNNLYLPKEFTSIVKDDLGKVFLLALVFLVGCYDLHLAIMLGVLVFVLIVKYDRKSLYEGFQNSEDDEEDKKDKDEEPTPDMDEEEEKPTKKKSSKKSNKVSLTSPPYEDEIEDESKCPEGQMYVKGTNPDNNKKVGVCVKMPNETLPEDKDLEIVEDEVARQAEDEPLDEELSDDIEGFGCGCANSDSLVKKVETFVSAPKDSDVPLAKNSYCLDKWGYDQAGCRYDMKSDPANDYPYGPPLANCQTYRDNQLNITGTVFYPLNH